MTSLPQFQDYPTHAAQLINAAVAAVNPAAAVNRYLQRNGRTLSIGHEKYELTDDSRVFLISIGKAAVPMALAAAEILDNALTNAIVVAKKTDRDWGLEIENAPFIIHHSSFKLFESGHPIPNEESVRAATAALDLATQTTDADLVIFLISGGASALLSQPLIPLTEWQQLTNALLASGCTINKLNCVRRQLDQVKGGGLASAYAPAACASLILSDVIGNPLADIGSGPTVFTNETPADALAILTQYQVEERLDTAVWERVTAVLHQIAETTPASSPRNQHLIIGDVGRAAAAALTKAAQLGFLAQILTTHLEGEAREIGKVVAALAKDTPAGRCLILGGETTVTLRGSGRGGRNQEQALAAAIALEGWPNRVIISFATDGEDGPTDAAGGIVTGETATEAAARHLNPTAYLKNNDSYTFFQRLEMIAEAEMEMEAGTETGSPHIRIGSTGTNVNDLLIILSYPTLRKNDA